MKTKKIKKQFLAMLLAMVAVIGLIVPVSSVSAEEGKADSYWGNIPENKTFAFVDSRYYDGTDYVKVFNVGFYMGTSGQYYTNGDWTDMTTVYRREDYYSSQEFIDFSENGKVSDPKPDGYPTNDVGGDADGQLSSYNAGTYTNLSWTNFSMFGRYWYNNYGIESVINASNIATYVEIWKVNPELSLSIDNEEIDRGETFTVTLTISNHFNNMEGLPTADDVAFTVDNAEAVSEITKTDNTYTQTFKATEDTTVTTLNIEGKVLDTATNYNEGSETLPLELETLYSASYDFVSGTEGKELPEEVLNLLPADENVYKTGENVTAIQPSQTSVAVDGGTWNFKGYDEIEKKIISDNVTFTGTWIFTADEDTETPATGTTDNTDSNNTTTTDSDRDSINTPKTGDSTNLGLWLSLMLTAGSALAFTAVWRQRKKYGR